MLFGVIGDDFTGSSDIANTLTKGGMRVTQYIGLSTKSAESDVEAGVVALKTRTAEVGEAISQSLAAADWLLNQGCKQLFFKYCSTFDSTDKGNIGPVTEALMDRVGEDRVVMCPAFPATGRTVYQGHLFVFDRLLHESGMQDHPLTPMTDPDLRRCLSRQTTRKVSHIPHQVVAAGAETIAREMDTMSPGMHIADAVCEEDLRTLGWACAGRKLLTGGSGLAIALADVHLGADQSTRNHNLVSDKGRGAVISGSCSATTRGQIAAFVKSRHDAWEITAADVLESKITVEQVAMWAQRTAMPPLIYSSADPKTVMAAQRKYGRERTAAALEGFLGLLANALVTKGFSRLVVAGGETSGAVTLALGISSLNIGVEIAPGIPVMKTNESDIYLALKSGNFGGENFFTDALEKLGGS